MDFQYVDQPIMTCSMCAEQRTRGLRGETQAVARETCKSRCLKEAWIIICNKTLLFAIRMFSVFRKAPFSYDTLCRKTLKLSAFPVLPLMEQRQGWGVCQIRAGDWLPMKCSWWLFHRGSGIHANSQPGACPRSPQRHKSPGAGTPGQQGQALWTD